MSDGSPTEAPTALLRAVERLLEPLVRLMLRNGVTYKAFGAIARRVFVQTAIKDFALPRRKLSDSRIAILTGLARRDIAKLRNAGPEDGAEIEVSMNRAARVVAGWRRDPKFRDAAGRPATLSLDGDTPTFTELVRLYAGDVPVAATLDELERVDAISRTRDGRFRLASRAYVASADSERILTVLGSHVRDLITTIDYNLTREDAPARFQRRVVYEGIDPQRLDSLRLVIADEAQATLERIDAILAEAVLDESSDAAKAESSRLGVGIFWIENEDEDPPS